MVLIVSGAPFVTVKQHAEGGEVLSAAREEAQAWWVVLAWCKAARSTLSRVQAG